jgi:hypothetical protein
MQTLEFTDALTEIVKALRAEEIVKMIQGWFAAQFAPNQPPALADQTKDSLSELLLSSRSGFDQLSTRPTTSKILVGKRPPVTDGNGKSLWSWAYSAGFSMRVPISFLWPPADA